jgi:hypothetical protein
MWLLKFLLPSFLPSSPVYLAVDFLLPPFLPLPPLFKKLIRLLLLPFLPSVFKKLFNSLLAPFLLHQPLLSPFLPPFT